MPAIEINGNTMIWLDHRCIICIVSIGENQIRWPSPFISATSRSQEPWTGGNLKITFSFIESSKTDTCSFPSGAIISLLTVSVYIRSTCFDSSGRVDQWRALDLNPDGWIYKILILRFHIQSRKSIHFRDVHDRNQWTGNVQVCEDPARGLEIDLFNLWEIPVLLRWI